jgi:hypothetical protein
MKVTLEGYVILPSVGFVCENPKNERDSVRYRSRRNDNTKTDFKEIVFESVDLIHVAQIKQY